MGEKIIEAAKRSIKPKTRYVSNDILEKMRMAEEEYADYVRDNMKKFNASKTVETPKTQTQFIRANRAHPRTNATFEEAWQDFIKKESRRDNWRAAFHKSGLKGKSLDYAVGAKGAGRLASKAAIIPSVPDIYSNARERGHGPVVSAIDTGAALAYPFSTIFWNAVLNNPTSRSIRNNLQGKPGEAI